MEETHNIKQSTWSTGHRSAINESGPAGRNLGTLRARTQKSRASASPRSILKSHLMMMMTSWESWKNHPCVLQYSKQFSSWLAGVA